MGTVHTTTKNCKNKQLTIAQDFEKMRKLKTNTTINAFKDKRRTFLVMTRIMQKH